MNRTDGMTGVVVGSTFGAIIGAAVGAFVVGVPGLGGALLAMVFGLGLGGYAGAVIGAFFEGEGGSEAESGEAPEVEVDHPTHSKAA